MPPGAVLRFLLADIFEFDTVKVVLGGSDGLAVCGIMTSGDDGNISLIEAGDVGCVRCRNILTVSGMLPVSARSGK